MAKLLLKLALLITLSYFANSNAWTQKVNLSWISKVEATHSLGFTQINQDQQGNYFILGHFGGTCDFDPGPSIFNVTSQGNRDLFLLKLSSTGNFLWVKTIGGNSSTLANSVIINSQGEIYLSGNFYNTLWLPSSSPVSLLVSNGSLDWFVLKLDSSGTILWAKSFGGTVYDNVSGMQLTQNEDIILTGSFIDLVDFDGGTGVQSLTSVQGSPDIFIQKLDKNGNYLSAQKIGGINSDIVYATTTDKSNSLLLTGSTKGSVDFDPGTGVHQVNNFQNSLFVLKLDPNGGFTWVKNISNGHTLKSRSIKTDQNNNIIVGGHFDATLDFDPSANTNFQTSTSGTDSFIWKLNKHGNLKWVNTLDANLSKLEIDDLGNIFSTGDFNGTTDFSFGMGTGNATAIGFLDLFVQKQDSTGIFKWINTAGGPTDANSQTLFFDQNRNLIHAGNFSMTVDFEPGSGITNLTSSFGNVSGYIRTLNQCSVSSTVQHTECKNFKWINGVYYSHNNNSAKHYLNASNGCDSIIHLDLQIIKVDTSVTRNGLTLTAGANGASYQWINCLNYSHIPNETNPSFTVSQNGSYALIIEENSCIDTSQCFTFTNVHVNEVISNNNLKTYPNPVKDQLKITTPPYSLGQKAQLIIFDNQGRNIFSSDIEIENELLVDFNQFKKGIYFITISSKEIWYSNFIIKE